MHDQYGLIKLEPLSCCVGAFITLWHMFALCMSLNGNKKMQSFLILFYSFDTLRHYTSFCNLIFGVDIERYHCFESDGKLVTSYFRKQQTVGGAVSKDLVEFLYCSVVKILAGEPSRLSLKLTRFEAIYRDEQTIGYSGNL